MSKLQNNIQKAIEKARSVKDAAITAKRRSPLVESHDLPADISVTSVFPPFRLTTPHDEVMEHSRIIGATDDRTAKSAYNVLRTRVLQRMRGNNWHSILVSSPGPGEGKTLTATNLAMSMARDVNQSTILIDLDLTRSSIAKYLGIDAEIKAGVGNFLQGQAELADILYSPTGFERLTIVPNITPVENSSDLISGPKMKVLVSQLRMQSTKSIAIYDMPPVLACDDVLAFYPNVDAILLVVSQGKTERKALEKTMAMLSGLEMLGIVLNVSDEHSADDTYDYY